MAARSAHCRARAGLMQQAPGAAMGSKLAVWPPHLGAGARVLSGIVSGGFVSPLAHGRAVRITCAEMGTVLWAVRVTKF